MNEHVVYWLTAVFPAVAAWSLNLIVRGKETLKNSGADWVLLIFVFDLTGALGSDDLQKHIGNEELRIAIQPLMIVFSIIVVTLWLGIVFRFEPLLERPRETWIARLKTFSIYSLVWTTTITITIFHVWLFLQRNSE